MTVSKLLTITLLGVNRGECTIEVKRPAGDTYKRTFTVQGFDKYLETAEQYCDYKGYSFIFKDQS